jgi:hypothetical protein
MSETSAGIQLNPSQRPGVTLALDPRSSDRLLVRSRFRPVRFVFGCLVAGFACYGQLDAFSDHEWAAFVFATFAAWAGIALAAFRRRLTLDRGEGLTERSRGAFLSHFSHREPLDRFDRVSIHLGGESSDRGVSTAYPVQLEGRDSKLEIDAPGYWEPARNLAEEIASFLRLPLHDTDRSGKLHPDEFDLTAGRRDVHVGPVSPPRKPRCRIDEETDSLLRVFIPQPDARPFLGLSIIIGLFCLVPLTIELFLPLLAGRRVDWPGVALLILIPAWVSFEAAKAVLTNGGVLEVTPGALRMTLQRPWGARVVTIPASELEDLVILDPEMGGPRSLLAHFSDGVLVARSDRESVRFGYGMKRKELAWLRSKVMSVLGGRRDAAPRPKRREVASRWDGAFIGAVIGILAAHATTGPLATCINVPFLQHVVSVGALAGLAAGLAARSLMGPSLVPAILAVLLSIGWQTGSESVQDRPRLRENPRYLRSSESIHSRRYLSGFIPVAAVLNLAGLELTLTLGERLWRRRKRHEKNKGAPVES